MALNVVHPASQPISVKPFARDEFDENHGQATKAIRGMSIAQAGLFRKFMEVLFKTHDQLVHLEEDGNGLPSEYTYELAIHSNGLCLHVATAVPERHLQNA